jgi:peroxiredoxin
VGDAAPDFALKDQNNKVVKLSTFKGKKEVVLFFYPKDDTPGCTKGKQTHLDEAVIWAEERGKEDGCLEAGW